MLVYSFVLKIKVQRSMSWPSTEGTVISTDILQECGTPAGHCYRPVIRYSYMVGGKHYESESYNIGTQYAPRHRKPAEACMKKYPVGEQVRVYYDPAKPDTACLLRKARSGRSMVFFGLVMLLAGGLFLLGVFRV